MNYEQNNGMNNNYNNQNYNNDFNNGYNNYPYNNPNMINNNKQPLSYHIKRFLIGFLLILILIFLLLWLLPTKQDMQDAITDSLNPLYDRIFGENIETMKEVAIAYYTTDRLPKKEGDTKKLTLGEMLEMKLLLEIKDKNGEMCDTDDSYVEITKMEKEYKMKVNLSCGDEEDYIIVYLGCYDYCLNDICEKKEETKKAAKQSVIEKVTNNVKKVTTTVKEKVTKTYYCKVVNGKYYDANGKIVSKTAYKKSCEKPAPKVYYCKIVNGKYYDANGKVVSKSAYEKSCKKEEPKYKYLYEKTVTVHYDKEYSDWSPWSEDIEYDPNNNNINWGTHETSIYEKTDSKTITTKKRVNDLTKPVYKDVEIYIGSYTRWTCGNYDFFINSATNTTYYTTTGWVYKGIVTSSKILNTTNNVRYDLVSIDYGNCNNDTCSITPKYTYKKYTRSTTTTSNVSKTKSELEAKCTNVVKKEIPVYNIEKDFVEYEKKIVTDKKTVHYYHYKTRDITRQEETKTNTYTAWSYSKEDEKLIAQGYKYTGKYEKVN